MYAALLDGRVVHCPDVHRVVYDVGKCAPVTQCTGGDFQGRLCESVDVYPAPMPGRIDAA